MVLRERLLLTNPNFLGLMTPLMTKVMQNPDILLPWYSAAPSLHAAYSDSGPYSSRNTNKVEALFSALLLRGVTFGYDVVINNNYVYFNNLHKWDEPVAANSDKPNSYLCKPGVYGNLIYNRLKALVAQRK